MKLHLGSNDHTVELKNNNPEADMDFSVIIDGHEDIMPQFRDRKSYSANSEYFLLDLFYPLFDHSTQIYQVIL